MSSGIACSMEVDVNKHVRKDVFGLGGPTVKLLLTKLVSDEDWEEWKNDPKEQQGVIGGNGFAAILGVSSYKTPNVAFKEFLSGKSAKPASGFIQRAMNHGTIWEPVIAGMVKYENGWTDKQTLAPVTNIWEVEYFDKTTIKVSTSVDLLGEDGRVFEIKAPYYGIDTYRNVEEHRNDWLAKHPFGRPHYFWQAALYHVFESGAQGGPRASDRIHIVVGFADSDKYLCTATLIFKMKDCVRDMVRLMLHEIATTPRDKRLLRKSAFTARLTEMMEGCYVRTQLSETVFYSEHENTILYGYRTDSESEEEAEQDSRDETDYIPGEKGLPEGLCFPILSVGN